MVEVTPQEQIDVKDSDITIVYTDNVVNVEKATDLDIRVIKKEYSIVGDDIYIPKLYDDAPQWMKDLVNTVVNVSLVTESTELISQLNSALSAFATSYVPLNQYTQSILSLQDADSSLNALINSLNSTYNDGISNLSGQIIELQLTKASSTEVISQILSTISSELLSPTSALGSTIAGLQQAIVSEGTARSLSIETLESTLISLDGDISSTAQATDYLTTYVGLDSAGASNNTGLSAYLEDQSTGIIGGADSRVANLVEVDNLGNVSSKFEYDSVLNKNGIYYKSGFGLKTLGTGGNGSEALPYDSEFWINASRFKFTNNNTTGSVAPFTIDASGATPQITFNGKVSFSNVTNAPVTNRTYVQASQPATGMSTGDTWIDTDDNNGLYTYNGSSWIKTQSGAKTYLQTAAPTTGMVAGDIWVDSDDNYKQYRYNGSSWVVLAYNPATTINSGTTTIDGGKITTGSITASQINVTDLFSKNITYTGVITGGNVAGGGIIRSYNGKMEIDLVNGSIYIS